MGERNSVGPAAVHNQVRDRPRCLPVLARIDFVQHRDVLGRSWHVFLGPRRTGKHCRHGLHVDFVAPLQPGQLGDPIDPVDKILCQRFANDLRACQPEHAVSGRGNAGFVLARGFEFAVSGAVGFHEDRVRDRTVGDRSDGLEVVPEIPRFLEVGNETDRPGLHAVEDRNRVDGLVEFRDMLVEARDPNGRRHDRSIELVGDRIQRTLLAASADHRRQPLAEPEFRHVVHIPGIGAGPISQPSVIAKPAANQCPTDGPGQGSTSIRLPTDSPSMTVEPRFIESNMPSRGARSVCSNS